jgi:hypothetical protein
VTLGGGERVTTPQQFDALYSEDGDIVWFPVELAPNHGKARYLAWTGRGLPVGFKEMDVDSLIALRVRKRFVRDVSLDADPPALFFDEERPWHICSSDAPGAVEVWEVRWRG